MNTENDKDLNLDGGSPSAGDGQPENNDSPDSDSDTDDETVEIPKSKYEKILEDKENYKEGLLSYKEKYKSLESDKNNDQDSEDKPSEDTPMTKKDFYKVNERKAINKFVEEHPEVEENWDDFVKYYPGKRGKETEEDILKDLDDAKTLFDKYHSDSDEDDDKSKRASLSSETTTPKASKKKRKSKKKSGKDLFPEKTPPKEWYKKEE